MQTIYNAAGEEKTCDSVDAREHIETGRWFAEAPEVDESHEVADEPVKTSKRGRK